MTSRLDELAELMAEGCPTIVEAARRMGLSQQTTDQYWQRIRRALDQATRRADGGRQAV